MVELTDEEWQQKGRKAFERVFRAPDPFVSPLNDVVEHRAILYPICFHFKSAEFDAVLSGARAVGDDHLCLSVTEHLGSTIEFLGSTRDESKHWFLNDNDFEAYCRLGLVGVLENALYSPAGEWGIIISHEYHAVAGGNRIFMKTLSGTYPGYESGIFEFLDYWSSVRARGVDVSWVSPLIRHVYGESTAEVLLGVWGGAT